MSNSYSIFLWLLFVTPLAFIPEFPTIKDSPHEKEVIKRAVQKTSTLQIKGSTNRTFFGCGITNYYQPGTID